jgi:hypothetical protein
MKRMWIHKVLPYFQAAVMHVTGHSSTALLHDSSAPAGTDDPITAALSSFILNASGHVETQSPHPMHASASMTTFIIFSFPISYELSAIS